MNSEQWEARCRRCGRCCYEKIDYEGEIYYTDEPCEYLDLQTRLCTIYDQRRHQIREGCAPLTPEVLKMGALPADCPYVEGIEDYRAPHPFEEEE
jgi:hypothetical protein